MLKTGKIASDCMGAITINDTAIGPVVSPPGFGDKLEIKNNELGDPLFIEREHNTVWYKFTAPYDAILTFDLIPVRPDDDFDFMLYQYSGPNFCKEVAEETAVPIRTNISRKNIEVRGMTGLRHGEVNEFVPSGPGSSYSRPLKVQKGQTYYMLVDNPFRENKGHSIYLHYKKIDPDKPKEEKKEEEKETDYEIPITNLQVDIVDRETGDPVGANIAIDGVMLGKTVDYKSQSRIVLEVRSYKEYTINVNKKGYLMASKKVTPRTDSVYKVKFELKPMEKGDKVTLENIRFEGDETTILKESRAALNQLYEFLTENDEVQVEIQGHVNAPGERNKRRFRKLSEERAQAVHDYLVEHGISSSRLDFKGFGNSEMKYPEPINEYQEKANRRVEIEILALN